MLETKREITLKGKETKLLFLVSIFSNFSLNKCLEIYQVLNLYLKKNYFGNNWDEISIFIYLLSDIGIAKYALDFKEKINKKDIKFEEIFKLLVRGRKNFVEIYENEKLDLKEKIILDRKIIQGSNMVIKLRKELYQIFNEESMLNLEKIKSWFEETYVDLENYLLKKRYQLITSRLKEGYISLTEAYLYLFDNESDEVFIPIVEEGKIYKKKIKKLTLLNSYVKNNCKDFIEKGMTKCFLEHIKVKYSLEIKILSFHSYL